MGLLHVGGASASVRLFSVRRATGGHLKLMVLASGLFMEQSLGSLQKWRVRRQDVGGGGGERERETDRQTDSETDRQREGRGKHALIRKYGKAVCVQGSVRKINDD